jgi:hypothetical protein
MVQRETFINRGLMHNYFTVLDSLGPALFYLLDTANGLDTAVSVVELRLLDLFVYKN